MPINILSPAEQVAAHLREEIASGRWKENMPGLAHLQSELGVNQVTINAALHLLEQQGLLVSQGRRKGRRISVDRINTIERTMRFRILPYDPASLYLPDHLATIDQLHRAGFEAQIARKSLHELGMNPSRVAKYIRGVEADGWIISGGSSEVLTWFSEQSVPAIALFGSMSSINIAGAGAKKGPVTSELVHKLVTMGHRRIVTLSNIDRVVPKPALYERNFLATMKGCGITTGRFNLPAWEPTPEGLHQCIDELFKHTAPTAIIVSEPRHCIAVQQHLADRGIKIPEDVSLICCDTDASFAWGENPVTHMRWDLKKVVNRVVRWAKNISINKEDRRQYYVNAELIRGATIGPPRN